MPDRHPAENAAADACPASGDPVGPVLPGQRCTSRLASDGVLACVTCLDPAWVIVRNHDGTFTARRDAWGNQQIITVPTLEELAARLLALQRGLPG